MGDLYLLWKGPRSDELLTRLTGYFDELYPSLTGEQDFILARNLEEAIREILSQQPGVLEIEDQLFYQGDLRKMNLRFIIRSGDQGIFPAVFFISEGLQFNPETIELLYKIIEYEIEDSLGFPVKSRVEETYEKKEFEIFLEPEIVLTEDFEKTQLGLFFYLLYLQKIFQNDPNVCVMISPLKPLISRAKQIEFDLGTLPEDEFIKKYPAYQNDYRLLIKSYQNEKLPLFRFSLLYSVVSNAGPYIVANEKNGKIEAKITNAFRSLFKACQNSGARYTVSLVSTFSGKTGHATLLIFDNKEKIIERFDPNGSISASGSFLERVTLETDRLLDKFGKEVGYLYISPEVFCPRVGVQSIESLFDDKNGYCASWSIIYGEERLRSTGERGEVAKNLLNEIINKYNLRGHTPRETGANVQKWMQERIHRIFGDMKYLFEELAEAMDIKLNYVNGRLIYNV